MAKNWKKLLPTEKAETSEINLKKSFQDLLQLDDTLKSLLKEREDLEQQMKALSKGSSETVSESIGKNFDQPIDSFQTKRKQDKKQFEAKKYLEEKITAKKLEFKHWENQRDKLKIKINKAKKLIERSKTRKEEFLKGDFEARWQEKRSAFRDKIKKKAKDIWSEKRDEQKKPVVSKSKDPIFKKVVKNIEQKPKIKKVKEQWGKLRDKKKEAQKLKSKGEKKWNDIQKKSMVDSFDVLPKEGKNELKQFEDDFKNLAQKEKDNFEEKQQKLKDKLKEKVTKSKDSLADKKKKEEGVKQKKKDAKKREDKRQQRQNRLREDKKNERKKEQKREERREERKKRKKDKYA